MTAASPPVDRAAREPERAAPFVLRVCDRLRWPLFALIAVLYAAGFNGEWRIGPDSAIHANIALRLHRGEGFVHPLDYHHAVSPGLAWMLSASFTMFGEGSLFPLHVVMALLAMGALALFHGLVRLHFDRPTAVVATLMLALTARFYRYAFELMPDLPFLVGLLMFLLGYEAILKKRFHLLPNLMLLVGGLGMMAAFRSVVLVFFAAMLLTLAGHAVRGGQRGRWVAIGILCVATLLLARGLDPRPGGALDIGADESIAMETLKHPGATIGRVLRHNVPTVFEEAAPEAFFGTELGPGLNTLATLAVLVAGGFLLRHRPLWAMLILAFLASLLIFPNVTPRYLLPILPLAALGWWCAIARINRAIPGVRGGAVFVGMMTLWILPNAIFIGKEIDTQRARPFATHWKSGRYVGFAGMGDEIRLSLPPGAIILTRHDDELREPFMFFARRTVLPATARTIEQALPHAPQAYYLYDGAAADRRRIRAIERRGYRIRRAVITVERPDAPPLRLRPITMRDDNLEMSISPEHPASPPAGEGIPLPRDERAHLLAEPPTVVDLRGGGDGSGIE